LTYADYLVIVAEEEAVLQSAIDRLIEVGRLCGMEMSM
jgi:hypothetical protein